MPAGLANGTILHAPDTTLGYDAYGNLNAATTYASAGTAQWTNGSWVFSSPGAGSAARTVNTTYDSVFHVFPIEVKQPSVGGAARMSEQATYNYRMGVLASVTDPNNRTSFVYNDIFGRFERLVRPGDTVSYPTTQAWYGDWELPVRYQLTRREVAGQAGYHPTEQFYDGLGRLIQVKQEVQEVAQMLVADYRYDGLGQVTQASQPRYVSESSPAFWYYTTPSTDPNVMRWSTASYDALGRSAVMLGADGSRVEHVYGLTQAIAGQWWTTTM